MSEAIALWDFHAQGADELSLSKNDVVMVMQKYPDEWWQVRKLSTGQMGVVPSNYLFSELKGPKGQGTYLPPNWESAVDADSGERYYYNKATGAVQYDLSSIVGPNAARLAAAGGGGGGAGGLTRSSGSLASGDLSEFKRLREEADAKLAALRFVRLSLSLARWRHGEGVGRLQP